MGRRHRCTSRPSLSINFCFFPNTKALARDSNIEAGWNQKKEETRISKLLFDGDPPKRDGKIEIPPSDCWTNKKLLLHQASIDSF